MARPAPITLSEALGVESLTVAWRAIKKLLRDELVRDPIDHLAYEAHLDANLRYLSYKIQHQNYTPSSHTIIRSAKKDGLTRPLAFLEIEDQIAYRAICDQLACQLTGDFPAWVNFSRAQIQRLQQQHDGEPTSRYETWFDAWMRHQTIVTKFVADDSSDNDYVVEGDISNFFASINLDLLRDFIFERTTASRELVNTLFMLLRALLPRPGYSTAHDLGLPQENFDCSRTLAHAFLKPLDDTFEEYGLAGRYARWVDDFRIAVKDKDEGKRLLNQAQSCLESIGLTLNTSKTRIIRRRQAKEDLFLELNAFLERVHEQTKSGEADLGEFEDRLAEFLQLAPSGGWERVLRRFYTEARRLGSGMLEERVWDHIVEFPQSARAILRYVSGRPWSAELLDGLWRYLKSGANVYQDVEIEVYEFLLQWHVPAERRKDVAVAALDHFFGRRGFSAPVAGDYSRALIALSTLKYGDYKELASVEESFRGSSERHFVRYAYLVLMASSDFREEARKKVLVHDDPVLRRLAAFAEEILRDPGQYKKLVLSFMAPRLQRFPDRFWLEARAMAVIRLARESRGFRGQWERAVDRAIGLLRDRTAAELRDDVALRWLERERNAF